MRLATSLNNNHAMERTKFEVFKNNLTEIWQGMLKKSDEESSSGLGREKIVVFTVSFILAFCLWLLVNLSRDFNLDINLPISVANVPQDQALREPLPETATVGISGEGWKLINFYNNPPPIDVNITDSEINLYDQVRQNMNALPDINVQKVQPLILSVNLEEKVSKKVPVVSHIELSFRDQFSLLDSASFQPDSITITGASSLVENIRAWPTDSLVISDISGDISRNVSLKEPEELISLEQSLVNFTAPVAQFTEGEVRVKVDTRNLPITSNVSFSPSSISVKFDVPIANYADLEGADLFDAYIPYDDLMEDSTGFVRPKIELKQEVDYPIKIRSFQPNRVAYFMVLDS